jgi:hypothetical protein
MTLQVHVALNYLKVKRADSIDVHTARHLLISELEQLGQNTVREAERAMPTAINLVKKRVGSFADLYGHLLRSVNQIFGGAVPEWKSWWVTHGLANFRRHCAGNHDRCSWCGAYLCAKTSVQGG